MRSRYAMPALVIFMLMSAAFLYYRSRSATSSGSPNPLSPTKRGGFSEALFVFAPTAKAENGSAGWQEAKATLSFMDPSDKTRGAWTCNLVVGMPLRADKWGELTPDYAAYAAAATATDAANAVMPKQPTWTPAAFCPAWREDMQRRMDGIEGLSAKVSGSE